MSISPPSTGKKITPGSRSFAHLLALHADEIPRVAFAKPRVGAVGVGFFEKGLVLDLAQE
jgi:hypothetical protein